MHLKEYELRLAIHQLLDYDALALVERRSVAVAGDAPVDVHLFELDGHPLAKRCYAWSVEIDARRSTAPVVLQDEAIDTAEKAVLVYRKVRLSKPA